MEQPDPTKPPLVDPRRRWPAKLWLVRHGESAGNVARDLAHAQSADHILIDASRDVDVPLSDRGKEQARALGAHFASLPAPRRPDVILVSTYVRARDTAAAIIEAGGVADGEICHRTDERLREREFGILDRLTSQGIRNLFPEQAAFRAALGKFYHRPPGGESWCDVILRLRSALDTVSLHHAGKRVVIVAHEVVVLCLRYLLEDLTEAQLMEIDAVGDVANCAITTYALDESAGKLVLERYNDVEHLREQEAPVTSAPDVPAAPR
jgi:2,3-bisphosphoglycerate-dependent phosphoglycerate mutase